VTSGAAYSWAASNFAWNDAQMGERKILSLASFAYGVNNTDSLAFSETPRKTYAKNLAESFSTFDAAWRTVALFKGESFNTADSSRRSASISISELFSARDTLNFAVTHIQAESLGIADTHAKSLTARVAETLLINDTLSSTAASFLAFEESFDIQEVGARDLRKAVAEAFATVDEITKALIIDCDEALSMIETYSSSIGFILHFLEVLQLAEASSKEVTIPQSDSFGVTSDSNRHAQIEAKVELAFAESLSRTANFKINFSEGVFFNELCRKAPLVSANEFFKVVDRAPVKTVNLSLTDSLSVVDKLGRIATFGLALAEGLSVVDAASRATTLSFAQTLSVVDALQRAGDMIVSDMVLSSVATDLSGFKDLLNYGNVPGYERWRDFIPGDYEYEEAMFRAVLESVNSDRAMLSGFQVSVDVPDLIDRGVANIDVAENGVNVTFARKFHIIPEMTIAIRGGTGIPGIPAITDVTTEGFHAVLQASDTGALTTGTFTWAAHGY